MTPEVYPVINSVDGLIQWVHQARESKRPLVDYGIYHAKVGHAPPANHTAFSQTGDIIEHYENDFTIRASAGITLGKLNESLMATNQFLPINADDDLTLGEVINHNMYGPMRCKFGSIRDLLLGLHYVDSFGHDIHVGGRTVKNVAGLDVTRLLVGSMGELGIIHQATLRTYAVPQEVARVDLEIKSLEQLPEQITAWMISPANPTSMHLRRLGDAWHLEVSYFGSSKANDVQVNALKDSLTKLDQIEVTDERRETLTEQFKHGQQSRAWQRKCKTLMRIIFPPREIHTITQKLTDMGITQISGMPAHGCLLVGGQITEKMDNDLRPTLIDTQGMRLWITPPIPSEDHPIPVKPFAPVQSDWQFLQKIKQTMDPNNLFNPGRFIRSKGAK